MNLFGSVESKPLAHAPYIRHVELLSTATTKLTAVCLCHMNMKRWHRNSNVVIVLSFVYLA